MIKRLNRAKAIARQRAAETDRVQYVVHFCTDPEGEGYYVMDADGLDRDHVSNNEIVFATA